MCGVATIPFVIWYSKPRREWALGVPVVASPVLAT